MNHYLDTPYIDKLCNQKMPYLVAVATRFTLELRIKWLEFAMQICNVTGENFADEWKWKKEAVQKKLEEVYTILNRYADDGEVRRIS